MINARIKQNKDLSNIHNYNRMSRCPNTVMFLQHPEENLILILFLCQ